MGCATRDSKWPMFLTRSEYDRGVNTFSPEGRLFQVEYAIEAIKIGTTAIGVCTDEGIVIAVEKRLLSPLQEPSSVEKIYEIDSHIGVAMSGLSADARTLVDHARSESQYHRFTFNEPMPVEALTQAVCDLALKFGESGDEKAMSRPFGVALLIAPNAFRGLLRLFQFRKPSEARVAAPDSRLPRMAAMEWGRLPQNAAVGRTLLGRAVQIHFLGSGMCRSACLTVLW